MEIENLNKYCPAFVENYTNEKVPEDTHKRYNTKMDENINHETR